MPVVKQAKILHETVVLPIKLVVIKIMVFS